jgi:hypothetical protein
MSPPSSGSKNKPSNPSFACQMLWRWFLTWFILRPWKWRRYTPPKCRLTFNTIHGVIFQEIEPFKPPTGLIFYIVAHERHFEIKTSLNMQAMNLKRSRKTSWYNKRNNSVLEVPFLAKVQHCTECTILKRNPNYKSTCKLKGDINIRRQIKELELLNVVKHVTCLNLWMPEVASR